MQKMRLIEYVSLAIIHRQDPFYVKYLKGKKVLDIACGRGEFLMRDPLNYVGIDLDQKLIAICRNKGLKAFSMDALELNFSDKSFDAVHAAQIIEHFTPADAVAFLAEISRVLKPDGVVFITTPGNKNVWNTFSHIRPYPPVAFKKLLKSSTENYIRNKPLDLYFVDSFGHRFYFRKKIISLLSNIWDMVNVASEPMGWTIILRKKL